MRAMKKATKRMIALFLTAIMTLAMAVTSFATTAEPMPAAAPQKGNLTVHVNDKNTLKGQKINVYKLFDLTVSGATEKKNYAYTVNSKYEALLKDVLKIAESSVTSQKYYEEISKLSGEFLQNFADEFTQKALTNQPALEPEQTSGKIGDVKDYTFQNLDRGYYLVYQTGTKEFQSSLTSVKAEANEITLKGEAPSINKTADKETVEVGQVITYTIKGTIPDTTGYENYVYKIHDKLTDGLDFVKDAKGTPVGGTEYPVSVQIGVAEASTQNAVLSGLNNRTMTLDLSTWIRNNQASKGQEITITYYAKVNEDAVVQTNNSASLEYGNDPENTTTTTPDVVTTPTYPLDINKKIKDTATMLADATFRLYRTEEAAKAAGDDAIKVTGTKGSYAVAADQTSGNMDMVTAATDLGKKNNLHLNGLAAGEYWLVETDAPAGYNKLTAPIKITIAKSGDTNVENWTISKDNVLEDDKIIDIENSTGTILPDTGGMGTVLFTVVGLIMILGVAISFIRSRKTEE